MPTAGFDPGLQRSRHRTVRSARLRVRRTDFATCSLCAGARKNCRSGHPRDAICVNGSSFARPRTRLNPCTMRNAPSGRPERRDSGASMNGTPRSRVVPKPAVVAAARPPTSYRFSWRTERGADHVEPIVVARQAERAWGRLVVRRRGPLHAGARLRPSRKARGARILGCL